jgi:hypothetical protein
MNQQDQQAIDELFQRLSQTAEQAGPRDPEAEARIQQHFQQGPPGLLYHMAQTLVAQQYALQQARAELADCRQQSGSSAGFAPPRRQGAGQPGYRGYPPPPPYQPSPGPYQQASQPAGWQRSGGQGFLAGAGRLALGVGGGILAAEALTGLLDGGGLFGGDRDDDDRGDDDRGDDRGDGQDDSQDYGGQDGGQDYGDGGFDGGGFDGGGFDGDPGGW